MQVISEKGFVADIWAETEIVPWGDYDGQGAVIWPVDRDPSELAASLATIKLIVIPFANSADGRGFSHAAGVRALGYDGHIRAQGHILVDQFRAALRCGFDDVQISHDQSLRNPEAQWLAVAMGQGYQERVFAA